MNHESSSECRPQKKRLLTPGSGVRTEKGGISRVDRVSIKFGLGSSMTLVCFLFA